MAGGFGERAAARTRARVERLGERLRVGASAAGALVLRGLRGAGRGTLAGVAGLGARLRPRRVRSVWRVLNFEQRTAAVGSLLLLASVPGPFSFVEAALVLVALAVIAMLYGRAERRPFHLPFGDGQWVTLAGGWCAVLILYRLLERPLGQTLLALACAVALVLAGQRERARRPADDLPRRAAGQTASAARGGGPT